jgi:hypothetical protein
MLLCHIREHIRSRDTLGIAAAAREGENYLRQWTDNNILRPYYKVHRMLEEISMARELAALLLQEGMEEERVVWGRAMGLHTRLHDLALIGVPIKNDEV